MDFHSGKPQCQPWTQRCTWQTTNRLGSFERALVARARAQTAQGAVPRSVRPGAAGGAAGLVATSVRLWEALLQGVQGGDNGCSSHRIHGVGSLCVGVGEPGPIQTLG